MDASLARWRVTLLAASALTLALLAPGGVAQSDDGFPGDLTVHATLDGPAGTEFETCQFYARGHGAPGANGTVTFYYAPNGTYEPTIQELAFSSTVNATGGFDFVAGPFDVPVRVDPAHDPMRANDLVARIMTEEGEVIWFLQGLDLVCPPSAEVPFFTSPMALGLGLVGILGAGMVLYRKR